MQPARDSGDEVRQFVEDLAFAFEAGSGMPRSAGRIFAVLLTSPEPYLSAPELTTRTGLSKGSVSTMTRVLENGRLIRRIVRPGSRRELFEVSDMGGGFMIDTISDATQRMVATLEQGAALFRRGTAEHKRLDGLASFYRFLELELPGLLARYRAERATETR